MGSRSTDLKIFQKANTLYNDFFPVLLKFPQAEKFALSQDIKNAFYSLMQSIVLANEIMHKRKMHQSEIDGYLSLLIVLFNIAKTRKYITEKKNLQMQLRVEEIGRMLGGWKKTTK